jgi:hypothetical protein
MPENSRAFRFVFPTLLVASHTNAYLWDVPSGRLIQTIPEIQGKTELGSIRYVELSAKYVVICGKKQLRIFSRSNQGKLLLAIPTTSWKPYKPALQTQSVDFGRSMNDKLDGVLEPLRLVQYTTTLPLFYQTVIIAGGWASYH